MNASVPYASRNEVSPVVEYGAAEDDPVRGFGLAVGLGVFHRYKVLLYVNRTEEFTKLLVRELRSVICDNDLWNPKPRKYVSLEETEHVK
ncbi:hypothetical protein A2U01_0054539, partial [Trifolium medium]|nr:hypothetical protein [Trifolium medium]